MKTHKSKITKMCIMMFIVWIFSFLFYSNAKADALKPTNPTINANEQKMSIPSQSSTSPVLPFKETFIPIAEALALSINEVNFTQIDGSFDETDMVEDFNHFSYQKYQEVINGQRQYRYLQFQTYWDDFSTDKPHVKVIVNIQDSENNENDKIYLESILTIIKNKYRVDTSKITDEQKSLIINDIASGNRLSCVKSLRLLSNLFISNEERLKQLFPQIYQLNFVRAGELINYVQNGSNLFISPNVLQPAKLPKTIATNVLPHERPELFENKVVVYFRPILNSYDTGHVGVGLVSSRDNYTTITTFEVNGETGMAHSHNNIEIDVFRQQLYSILTSAQSSKALIGWLINI